MPLRENISYLVPRDPSIRCWSDRVKLPAPYTKNLLQLDAEEYEEMMGDKIKVYLRLKPSSSCSETPYTVLDSNTLQTEAPKESVSYKNVTNGRGKLIHKFTFTSILDQETTQRKLFSKCAVKNLKKFLSGENHLLMAYGTTSAGKTYTMQGNVENPGVIPRAIDFVFTALGDQIISVCKYTPWQYNEFIALTEEQLKRDLKQKNFILSLDLTKCQKYPDPSQETLSSSSGFSDCYENVTFKEMQSNLSETESFELESDSYRYAVWISMVEIYNEHVYDLLEVPTDWEARPKLALRDDELGNTYVKNLRYVNVSSGHEAFQILQFGRRNLHLAPTALNHSSSRSHCIFTITLAKFLAYGSSSLAVVSRFSFCDLAGMERAKKTLNVKDRLVESKSINMSLSIFVKCLTTIKENQNSKEKKIIPYRESKLTKLFRDAVTGKEQFSLIVNVTTEPNLFDETLNVLKFSAIAQKIVPQNVFARPRCRPVKKSRFSRMVMNSSYNNKTVIDWETTSASASSYDSRSQLEPDVKPQQRHTGVEELEELVSSLREQLARERKRCEDIETEIRKELTSNFATILKKENERHQTRFENETERLHEMYEKKQMRLALYYKWLGKKKRPKPDDDASDFEDEGGQLNELKETVDSLKSETETLKSRVQELLEENNQLKVELSGLKFRMVEKERELVAMQRAEEAGKEGGDALVKELRKQLEEANAKISDLKTLLDEAADDYKEVEETNKFLRKENEIFEQNLAENAEVMADLRNENAELQKMLLEKRVAVEKLEDANEKLKEVLDTEQGKGQKKAMEVVENGVYAKEVEILREQLKKTSEWLSLSRKECEDLRVDKQDLERDMEIEKLKIADLQSKVLALEKKESELETRAKEEFERAREFENEAMKFSIEKANAEGKCAELELEVKTLQKEVKDLINASKRENEKLLELESFSTQNEIYQKESLHLRKRISELEEQLNDQTEKLKTCERESKLALEALKTKFDAVEFQNSVMKNLKDEAERQAYEVPQLHEEIKRLEREIENREKDMASFNENRRAIFNNYEKELTRLKEENERLRKDVLFANEVIAKNMTPLKGDKAEINRLKESVKKKDEEINKLKTEVESIKKQRAGDSGAETKLEESSSKENSPFVSLKTTKPRVREEEKEDEEEKSTKDENTPEKLSRQVENLSIAQRQTEPKSTRKKIDLLDESVHPSTIKNTNKGRKKKGNGKGAEKDTEKTEEEKENFSVKKKGKCYKKLFTDNDFDGLVDLNASPLKEISRLRPRK